MGYRTDDVATNETETEFWWKWIGEKRLQWEDCKHVNGGRE
jgi:hypothetical protein